MFVCSPSVYFEIAVKREDFFGAQFASKVNQARICKIDAPVPIFPIYALHLERGVRESKRNLKHSRKHVREDRIRGAGEAAEQIATLGNHSLTGHQRSGQRLHRVAASPVVLLAPVEQGHNNASIEQNGLQRPNPCRCFLLDPRSGRPEANFPSPTIRRLFAAGFEFASRRSPSRTTFEGLQPNSFTRNAKVLRASGSSLAWTVAFILLVYYKTVYIIH